MGVAFKTIKILAPPNKDQGAFATNLSGTTSKHMICINYMRRKDTLVESNCKHISLGAGRAGAPGHSMSDAAMLDLNNAFI